MDLGVIAFYNGPVISNEINKISQRNLTIWTENQIIRVFSSLQLAS